jgi:hypothetical protein
MSEQQAHIACLGLRAKTGRAIAVVVSGIKQARCGVSRMELSLSAANTPALFQPYHEVMNLPWEQAILAVRDAERSIVANAKRTLESVVHNLRTERLNLTCIAVVGAPERNLAAIGSPHIRAHAAEGVLFRHVWQVAAEAIDVPCFAFSEKGFESFAAARLRLPIDSLRARLAELGASLGRPWRADEKSAAAAAWLALAMHEGSGS